MSSLNVLYGFCVVAFRFPAITQCPEFRVQFRLQSFQRRAQYPQTYEKGKSSAELETMLQDFLEYST
jgi:hypothetical protein